MTSIENITLAAIKYAKAHKLVVPDKVNMPRPGFAKAISDAVIHAEAHPTFRYAAALMQADHEFAESTSR